MTSTLEPHSPEIRRSTRTRKSTQAEKFGNAIPIGNISNNTEALITVATIQDSNNDGTTANESNNPTKIDNRPTTVADDLAAFPSPLSQTSEDILWTEVHMNSDTPENARETVHADNSPPRTTSSRYILDKPRTTEDSFSKEFEDAMNFLQSISPIRQFYDLSKREGTNNSTIEQTTLSGHNYQR